MGKFIKRWFQAANERIHSFNERAAGTIRKATGVASVTTGVVFGGEVVLALTAGWTMIQLAEYAVAIAVFVFVGALLVAKSVAWQGSRNRVVTFVVRVGMISASLAFATFFIILAIASREDRPWSKAIHYIAHRNDLKKRFPGGFTKFAVITSNSATAGHSVLRTVESHNFEITWETATITESNPDYLTVQLSNLVLTRIDITANGTQRTPLTLHATFLWRIDRKSKTVSMNNAVSFWGYELAGCITSDTGDEVEVAIGLQKTGEFR